MKKIIALVCSLLLMLVSLPALAEDTMPQEVQAFFDAMRDELNIDQISFAADQEAYVEGMPSVLLSYAISRVQYNSFYYYVLDDNTAITVCCLDGKPLAYIFDCNAWDFISDTETTHTTLKVLPDAYRSANPQQTGYMDAYDFVTDAMLQNLMNPIEKPFISEMMDYNQTLVSSHVFSLGGQIAIQLFPRAAYDGVTLEDIELTPEANHELSASMAINAERQLLQRDME